MVEIVFCILSFRWYLAMRNIFRHGQSFFSQKTLYRIRHSAFAKQNIYVLFFPWVKKGLNAEKH